MTPGAPERIPEALPAPKSGRALPLVWLVPAVALAIGAWLAFSTWFERGPIIEIHFRTAEGLQAGKTRIKYKDVDVGHIGEISLASDLTGVVVTAHLSKSAEKLLVEDTRFWVVRPRISGSTVSGLQTLLSGSYVAMDVGKSTQRRRLFIGLEQPPAFTTDVPGRQLTLRSEDIGSLDIGSPVYYRRLQVGQVAAYALEGDGKAVKVTIFINAPYDRFVSARSRFWHASGVDLALDAEGVRVKTESLVSPAIGGLAFDTPLEEGEPAAIPLDMVFELPRSQERALKNPDRFADSYVLLFNQSVRGLQPGAPVDFRGIVVGEVAAIHTQYDPQSERISIPVEIRVYTERFTSRLRGGAPKSARLGKDGKFVARLVERGLRAQLRTASLITGQLYVALDFFPEAPRAHLDLAQSPPELPTTPSTLEDLHSTLVDMAGEFNRPPAGGDAPVGGRDTQPDPEARATLADYLERNPQALLRGKSADSQ